MVAPDQTTLRLSPRPAFSPRDFEAAAKRWEQLPSDDGRRFDRVEVFQAGRIEPQVTWGTSPGQVTGILGRVPDPAQFSDPADQKAAAAALAYMALAPGTPITAIRLERVFIGSCTNGRIEDLRAAAAVVRGYRVAPGVDAMVVPGSGQVKRQAEAEGLDRVFRAAGLQWREPGCSMCLAMNPDRLEPGQRCAATSNRNFEGRQGKRRAHAPRLAGHGRRSGRQRAFR